MGATVNQQSMTSIQRIMPSHLVHICVDWGCGIHVPPCRESHGCPMQLGHAGRTLLAPVFTVVVRPVFLSFFLCMVSRSFSRSVPVVMSLCMSAVAHSLHFQGHVAVSLVEALHRQLFCPGAYRLRYRLLHRRQCPMRWGSV